MKKYYLWVYFGHKKCGSRYSHDKVMDVIIIKIPGNKASLKLVPLEMINDIDAEINIIQYLSEFNGKIILLFFLKKTIIFKKM